MGKKEVLDELAKLSQEDRAEIQAQFSNADNNVRALFSDAGQWAVHFSTVRMTLSTFFIGLSWTVVSLKWDNFSFPLYYGAIAIWVITGLFLILFTVQTHKFSAQQKKFKALMPTPGFESPRDTTIFGLRRLTCLGIWLPVLAFAFASWGYWELLKAWRGQSASVQGFDAVTMIGTSEVKFHATISSDLAVKMKDLRARISSQPRDNPKDPPPQPEPPQIVMPAFLNSAGTAELKK